MPLTFLLPIVPLISSNVLINRKFLSHSLNKCIQLIIVLVISLYISPKMVPAGVESTREKYGTILNSFRPDVKRLIGRLEQINYKIGRREVSE